MIISATPFRIEFAGGSTDIEYFYRNQPGHVLNATINHYVYVCINPKFDKSIRVSYSKTENVRSTKDLQNTRVKVALEHFNIKKGIEVVSIADIPTQGSGLGSSSSFLVGLLNALGRYTHKHLSARELAELACKLEIKKLGEPIGKQDQYAAAFGGLNLSVFYTNGRVEIKPIFLSPTMQKSLEDHLLLVYTGITRSASEILSKQKESIRNKMPILKKMGKLAKLAAEYLERGDLKNFAKILEEEWMIKKNLSSDITNEQTDNMYKIARASGAWGGRISGAGGSGFMILIAPPSNHQQIKQALRKYLFVPTKFTEAGSVIIFNNSD